MEFRRRVQGAEPPKRVALIPGSFNPPTNAHRALVEAALDHADEAVVVLPRSFPHKSYDSNGASLEDRIRMLEHLSPEPYSIAISEGGLFLEMADEFRLDADPATNVSIVCGRDAAERILGWNYPDPDALERMFASFELLVAARQGEFDPPERFRHRIQALGVASEHDAVSSTEVRNRIRDRGEWRHLVPEGVAQLVEKIYFETA
jgi:cytidyltransferase-like protein